MCEALRNDSEHDLGNRNLNNYASVISKSPPVAIDLLHACGAYGSLCLVVLIQLVKDSITIALEEFPKSITQLPDTDLEFQVRNQQQRKAFIVQWVGHHDYFLCAKANSFPVEKYRYFGSLLYDMLFGCWIYVRWRASNRRLHCHMNVLSVSMYILPYTRLPAG